MFNLLQPPMKRFRFLGRKVRVVLAKALILPHPGFSQHVQRFLCKASEHSSLSPPAAMVLLSKPAPDRASHLVTGPFDVDSVLHRISFVFEGSASTIQRGLKFHILQVLQCDNLGAGYALYIFHKRTPSPESEMWKKSALQGIY